MLNPWSLYKKIKPYTAMFEAEKKYDLKLEGFEIVGVNNTEFIHYFNRTIPKIKDTIKRNIRKQNDKIVLILRWNQKLINKYNFRYSIKN